MIRVLKPIASKLKGLIKRPSCYDQNINGLMKVLILAAGYATRLYPLTLTQPKPLLPVAGKPMIEYVIDNIAPIGVDCVYVVTNAKFAGHFQKWADDYSAKKAKIDFKIVNDG